MFLSTRHAITAAGLSSAKKRQLTLTLCQRYWICLAKMSEIFHSIYDCWPKGSRRQGRKFLSVGNLAFPTRKEMRLHFLRPRNFRINFLGNQKFALQIFQFMLKNRHAMSLTAAFPQCL